MTTTSQKILKYLKKEGIELTKEQSSYIEKVVDKSLESAYSEGINGSRDTCGCGQPSCSFCH
jgi:hypothetical protein